MPSFKRDMVLGQHTATESGIHWSTKAVHRIWGPRGASWESRALKTIVNIKSAAALLSVLTKDSVIYFLNLIIPGVLEMWILQLR